MNFAVIGVGGYVAPRHLKAIRDTGNHTVAALDPRDSVGILDQFALDVHFFTEFERLDRHLEKLKRGPEENRVHYVTICSPNYLHDAHCRMALRVGANVICEKPLVITPWNLDLLQALEQETGKKINTVLQLRVHPTLMKLRESLMVDRGKRHHDVQLTYITSRGRWYYASWKGSEEKSGGIATNIGIHFFDLLLWLFGDTKESVVHLSEQSRMAGYLELEHARVRWFLSLESADLPFTPVPGARTTYRSITIDGQEVEFSEGFTDLHTEIYRLALAGRGFGIDDIRPSTELAYRIRTTPPTSPGDILHPLLNR